MAAYEASLREDWRSPVNESRHGPIEARVFDGHPVAVSEKIGETAAARYSDFSERTAFINGTYGSRPLVGLPINADRAKVLEAWAAGMAYSRELPQHVPGSVERIDTGADELLGKNDFGDLVYRRANGERYTKRDANDRPNFGGIALTAEEAAADRAALEAAHATEAVTPGLDHGAAVDPNLAALDKQRAQLGAEAPLRSTADQHSTLGLGLFGAADGVRLDAEGEARPLKDLLDDLDREAAELKSIRDCL